jgi:BON domain
MVQVMNTLASHGNTRTAVRLSLAAFALTVSAAATVRADDPILRDADHTLLARNILQRDPQIGPLNLGVKVQDRVVTLWGPVPDVVLGVKAAELLRLQPEFRSVYNDLYFEEDFSFFPRRQPHLFPEAPPPATRPDAPVTLLPPVKEGEPNSVRQSGAPATLTTRPMDKKQPAAVDSEKASAAGKPPYGERDQNATSPRSGETGPRSSNAAPSSPESLLVESVRRLHQSEERFRELTFEVKDGEVTLRGSARRAEALYELARVVSQVPGVVRVHVRQN